LNHSFALSVAESTFSCLPRFRTSYYSFFDESRRCFDLRESKGPEASRPGPSDCPAESTAFRRLSHSFDLLEPCPPKLQRRRVEAI
jgi:hypothetical protein